MKLIRKVLVVLAILLVVSVAGIMISATCYHRYGPPAKDRRVQELLLAPLLQSHASLDEVARVVGIELSDFSVGSSNRSRSETHFSTPIRHRLQENAAVILVFCLAALATQWSVCSLMPTGDCRMLT